MISNVLWFSHHQNMLKELSWDLSTDDVQHLLLQIKVSRWPMMERFAVERFMAGRIVETKGI